MKNRCGRGIFAAERFGRRSTYAMQLESEKVSAVALTTMHCSLASSSNCHKHDISSHEPALAAKSRCRFTLGLGRQERKSYSCAWMIGVIRHRREQMNVLS